MSPILQVEGLTVWYDAVRALRDVRFDVEEGSVVAVLGANGAGKTTLLRAVNGLLRPRSGRVRVAGVDVSGRAVEDVVRLGVAHVPEGRGVIAELTVAENLKLGGLWRKDRAARGADLADVYDLFPALEARRDRAAVTLSGGERQMLALGRALMARPRVLLLDEPSLGLAPSVAAEITRVVARLRAERGMTVVLVEQNARSALAVADRGVVLATGRVVADGPAAELAADTRLRHAYLGF